MISKTREIYDDLAAITSIHTVSDNILRRIIVNGKRISFEVVTGAAVTLMNLQKFNLHFPDVTLKQSTHKLRGYSGNLLPLLERQRLRWWSKERESRTLPLQIVYGNGSSLIGRNWLKYMGGRSW
jgi:hypothetical protein